MQDRRISNDGIRINVSIEYDRAEISARRFSGADVFINDTIRLEYTWTPLYNGDTLTFADGSKYTFFNIYNHRELDEITANSNSIIRYVRRNAVDDYGKIPGEISYILKDTNFDQIDHSQPAQKNDDMEEIVFSEVSDSEEGMEEEEVEFGDLPFSISPLIISKQNKEDSINVPVPLTELSPEVPEEDNKPEELSLKDVLDTVASLNTLTTDTLKKLDMDDKVPTNSTKYNRNDGDIFADGDNTLKQVKRDKMQLRFHSPISSEHQKYSKLPLNMLMVPHDGISFYQNARPISPPIHLSSSGYSGQSNFMNKSSRKEFDERTFVLYRSKQKLLIPTKLVYDVICVIEWL